MARAQKPKQSRRPQAKSLKQNNLRGFAKRQSLKSQRSSKYSESSDVYEYQPENVRRSKVKLQLEKDELDGARRDISGSEDEDDGPKRNGLRPRLVGENDDEGGLGSDEDEEIDSDEAFDESDEERFAGFNFSTKKRSLQSRTVPLIDLNEDEVELEEAPSENASASEGEDSAADDEEEGDPEDFIDVLDMIDGKGPAESADEGEHTQKEERPSASKARVEGDDVPHLEDEDEDMHDEEDEGISSDESEEDESHISPMDDAISASGDEDDDVGTSLHDLQSFITNLDAGQKRKAPDDEAAPTTETGEARRQKRRMLKERTEAGEENEFAPHRGATKLNLDDLLNPLASSSSNLLSLKKSAKILTSISAKNQTLSAPLPQRTQERLDREAAYQQTKEEVDKWSATMKKIKEAEHLSFPLQAQPAGRTSNLELAAKFKPTTELESAVDRLLKSAKMREEDIAQTESLKMNHLSVEEVSARRAELAKMRELMFRAEAKAKRVAKIKSKTYRRIKKKEKAKIAAKLGEGSDDEDMNEETRMKHEVERARERATLKHKNTGKWAKAMRARGDLDEDQRRDISEMLSRGEKLRRRIQGIGSGDESEEGEDDTEDDEEGAADRIKASAFEELAQLDKGSEGEEDSGRKGKSIFEMKFMKDAIARDQQRAKQMADDFVREMGESNHEDDEDDELTGGRIEESSGATIERVGGRVTYRPGAQQSQLRTVNSLASDTSSITLRSNDLPSDVARSVTPSATSPIPEKLGIATEAPNPWLAPRQDPAKAVPKKHEIAVSKDSASVEKSKNKLRKKAQKHEEEQSKARNDAAVDISMSNVMTLGDNSSAGPSKPKTRSQSGNQRDDGDDDSDVHSEVEEQERLLDRKGKGKANGVKAFEQRDLVARAFAGDNVVRDFAEAKRREMQEDAPKEVDTTLPGWGSWGGTGTRKAQPKPHLIKKVAGVDPTTRADYKKAHVIISEKRDKKAAKYMVKDLPYPYTSKAQFERSMDIPIGTEWNTRVGFQRGTLPKIVTKPGTVINPLEKLL
ncbi:unnamed protein product [Somion occarium]|uniref:U3 small nucleolar RNA-associated protein 14 n=1 Tax=Somion occarium TaxID=3059160 RepID=A0ABP1CG78_9APHY